MVRRCGAKVIRPARQVEEEGDVLYGYYRLP